MGVSADEACPNAKIAATAASTIVFCMLLVTAAPNGFRNYGEQRPAGIQARNAMLSHDINGRSEAALEIELGRGNVAMKRPVRLDSVLRKQPSCQAITLC